MTSHRPDARIEALIAYAENKAIISGANPIEPYVRHYLATLALAYIDLSSSGFVYSRLSSLDKNMGSGNTRIVPPTTAL